MPEQDNAQPDQPQEQQATLRVRGQDTKTSYANMCLLFSTREELVMDYGMAFPSPNREQRGADMLVSNRIVMGLPAAKRLAIALSQAIQRYENAFGVIPLERTPAMQTAAAAPDTPAGEA